MPGDAPPLGEGKKVYLFPYDGRLCLAIGQTIWKKDTLPIAKLDHNAMAAAAAANDFPKLYSPDWKKLGEKILPSADCISDTPYFAIHASGNCVMLRTYRMVERQILPLLTTVSLRRS
jgi:hypothetical protein